MSRPGCVVAAVREGQPDVERTDIGTHEGAVLVPAAGLALVGHAAQRALPREQHRLLAEVFVHQRGQPCRREGLDEVEHRRWRFDRHDRPTEALGLPVTYLVGREVLVPTGGLGFAYPLLVGVKARERPVDVTDELVDGRGRLLRAR